MTPPFRADHVGSLLRPAALRDAHLAVKTEGGDPAALRRVEDEAIREAVAMQERLGLGAVTDGEFRRTNFHFDFLGQLDGVEARHPEEVVTGRDPVEGRKAFAPPGIRITGKVRHVRPIEAENFRFLHSVVTTGLPKQAIPSPTMLLRGGRAAVDPDLYPALDDYHADVAAAYRAEIAALGEAGCRYLQLDDTNLGYLCDPAQRDAMIGRGEDPDRQLALYASLINAALAERPPGMTVAIHVCRGNRRGQWAGAGGYDPIAETLFGSIAADAYFLEYDSARAGGFEPLAALPDGKRVVLGLVSTKLGDVEDGAQLERQVREAARFTPLERLCLSPQCGFASSYRGHAFDAGVQAEKLALVVETAARIWA